MCKLAILLTLTLLSFSQITAQTERILSGRVVNGKNGVVEGVSVRIISATGEQEQQTVTDAAGKFQFNVPDGSVTLALEGKNIVPQQKVITADTLDKEIKVEYVILVIHNTVVIEASALDPGIDRRNDTIYKDTLFSVVFLSSGDELYNIKYLNMR